MGWAWWTLPIIPHDERPELLEITMAAAEQWAAKLDVPGYAIDDETLEVEWWMGWFKLFLKGTATCGEKRNETGDG